MIYYGNIIKKKKDSVIVRPFVQDFLQKNHEIIYTNVYMYITPVFSLIF